jgi:hypothetical protein
MDTIFFNDDLEENILKIQYKDIKLCLIKNLFDDNTFNKLQLEVLNAMKNPENWEKLTGQESAQRKVLKLEASELIKDINNNLNESKLLGHINKIMDENYTSCRFKVWWDTADYFIDMHVDNINVNTSMQLYVTGVKHNHLGTAFAYANNGSANNDFPFLTLPYVQNTGYIFKNTSTIRHGMTMSVPNGFDRVSLYFYIN